MLLHSSYVCSLVSVSVSVGEGSLRLSGRAARGVPCQILPTQCVLGHSPGLEKVPSPESEPGRLRAERLLRRIAVRELSREGGTSWVRFGSPREILNSG